MKTIKTLLLVVALTFSSVLVASTNVENKRAESVITDEIGKLLKNPSFLLDHEIVASITLTLNKNNEMVVLSVDSEEEYVESYIKSRLNYSELPSTFKAVENTYVVPVRISPED